MSESIREVTLRTKGILPVQKLKILADAGIISGVDGFPIEENQFQPNSIDLRLGTKAHRVRSSFLPEMRQYSRKLKNYINIHFRLKRERSWNRIVFTSFRFWKRCGYRILTIRHKRICLTQMALMNCVSILRRI